MMSLEEVKALAKRSDPRKFLPTTIAFLKEMRAIENSGHERRGEPLRPWTENDEWCADQHLSNKGNHQ
jgi:hypothetical protein